MTNNTKFKIGDKVRINPCERDYGAYKNKIGKITHISRGYSSRYSDFDYVLVDFNQITFQLHPSLLEKVEHNEESIMTNNTELKLEVGKKYNIDVKYLNNRLEHNPCRLLADKKELGHSHPATRYVFLDSCGNVRLWSVEDLSGNITEYHESEKPVVGYVIYIPNATPDKNAPLDILCDVYTIGDIYKEKTTARDRIKKLTIETIERSPTRTVKQVIIEEVEV